MSRHSLAQPESPYFALAILVCHSERSEESPHLSCRVPHISGAPASAVARWGEHLDSEMWEMPPAPSPALPSLTNSPALRLKYSNLCRHRSFHRLADRLPGASLPSTNDSQPVSAPYSFPAYNWPLKLERVIHGPEKMFRSRCSHRPSDCRLLRSNPAAGRSEGDLRRGHHGVRLSQRPARPLCFPTTRSPRSPSTSSTASARATKPMARPEWRTCWST